MGTKRHRITRFVCVGIAAWLGAMTLIVDASPAQAASSIALKRNDFNRDGISDLLAVNTTTHCLYRWNGTGTGGLGSGTQIGCGWGAYTRLASPGDINGDGNGDLLAVSDSDQCLYRWLGNGSGGFGSAAQIGCGWGAYFTLVGAGDLNGDGHADLMAVNRNDGCLYRWWGTSTGKVTAGAKADCIFTAYRQITGVGDVNSDSKADLVGTAADSIGTNYGNGDGTLGALVNMSCFTGSQVIEMAGMGNFDGDSYGDFVIRNGAGELWSCSPFEGSYFGNQIGTSAAWSPYHLVP